MTIPWYVFAFLSAILFAAAEILAKRTLAKTHAMEFRTTLKTLQLPLVFLFIPFVDVVPNIAQFIIIFLVGLAAAVGGLFWSKAIKHNEISSVSPLLNLSPLFLVIFAFLILRERLEPRQYLGISILILGTYILEADHKISSLKEPIMKIIRTKTLHFALITLVLYSLAAVGDKYIISAIGMFSYLFWVYLFMTMINIVMQYMFHDGFKDIVYSIRQSGLTIFLVGVVGLLSVLSQYKAISMAMVTLVIPIKRLSTLFATVIGGELFHDHGLLLKAVACIILIIGSTLVVI